MRPVEGIPPTVKERITDHPPSSVGAREQHSGYESLTDSLPEPTGRNKLLKSHFVPARTLELDTGDVEGPWLDRNRLVESLPGSTFACH